MQCRSGCGACCIAPSINQAFYGMPAGKPAGVRCVHLLDDARCALFGRPERPAVCSAFKAEAAFCGANREEALQILDDLEVSSRPAP
ncbi:YkgJ family cysteine cluster protein [Saccharospirillum alexandrii]|uniref:YkgJ family cysteine cluster protein n=1 Tax=Saccharospirillum alexandrii TaxID=2448477 RepID=UPI003735A0BE